MKTKFFILNAIMYFIKRYSILWAISATLCVFFILYNSEIRTSWLGHSKFAIGDPIINRNSYEIAYADNDMISYASYVRESFFMGKQFRLYEPKEPHKLALQAEIFNNWIILHEAVRNSNGKIVLADPLLRWALRVQKLFGKQLK